MDAVKLERAARPAALGGYLKKSAAAPAGHTMHGGQSVRTADHNGHQISLITTYRVEVDGKVLKVPLMVDDSGNVHCHSLPNYQFDSAIDMIKAVIDAFPEDFPPPRAGKPLSGGGHAHKPAVAKRGARGKGRKS